jgi:hypothetical protein
VDRTAGKTTNPQPADTAEDIAPLYGQHTAASPENVISPTPTSPLPQSTDSDPAADNGDSGTTPVSEPGATVASGFIPDPLEDQGWATPDCPLELQQGSTEADVKNMQSNYGCRYLRYCRALNDGSSDYYCWYGFFSTKQVNS